MALLLTARQLGSVVESLEAISISSTSSDKRKFPRIAVEARIALAPIVNHRLRPWRCVLTRDISFAGLGLLQAEVVGQQEQFIVQLPTSDHARLSLVGVVMHCRKLADGIFMIGTRYLREVDENLVRSLERLARAEPPKTAAPVIR